MLITQVLALIRRAGIARLKGALFGGSRFIVLSMAAIGVGACSPELAFEDSEGPGRPIPIAKAGTPNSSVRDQDKVYEVVFGPPFPPFMLLDGNGGVMGYEVELLDAIAKLQGFKVKYSTYPWKGLFDNVTTGRKDIIGSGITITPERLEKFNFSNPIFESRQMAFSLKPLDLDNPEKLDEYTGIVQRDTSSASILTNKLHKTRNVKYSRTVFLGVKEVLNGRADFAISDSGPMLHYKRQYYEFSPVLHDFKELPTDYFGFGVSIYRQDDLIEQLNAGLEKLKKSGELEKIYHKWFNDPLPVMPSTKELETMFENRRAEESAMN